MGIGIGVAHGGVEGSLVVPPSLLQYIFNSN